MADNILGQNTMVFPNPAQSQLFIYLKNFNDPNAIINIYNTAGQLIYQKGIKVYNNSYFQEIDIAHYSAGAYLVKIQSGGKTIFVKKIIR